MKRLPVLFRPIAGILLSVVTVALSSLLLFLLRGLLSNSVVVLLYLVPVLVSAAYWGILAGISASILSFLTFNYLFISPYYSLRVAHPQDFLAMVVMLLVAVLISSLMARVQANLEQAQAREREARQLSRLSLELTDKKDEQSIAQAVACSLADFFCGATVQVELWKVGGNVCAWSPEGSLAPEQPPTRTIMLVSPRGSLGEISIWCGQHVLEPEEERLLSTTASQAALALDRALLAEQEARAHLLEESDRLRAVILSSVSHELRTPLATIQASATSLFNPEVELEPEARDELQSLLLEETEHMSHLVGNLLNMIRIEAGMLKLQRQWNSIAEIVDTSMRRLQRFMKQHRIQVDVSEDLPLVSIDSVLMEQVMINLVGNSLKFAPENSTIQIGAKVEDQYLLVSVQNQGPAIPDQALGHIFEKFYPLEMSESKQGTGLGLSICKAVIEAHGGKIWAANLPVGVAFYFTLPLTWEGARPLVPDEESEGA